MISDAHKIETTQHERVMHVQMNSRVNKLGFDFTSTLAKHLKDADQRDDIAVIVLSGNERAFSVGAALDELIDLSPDTVDEWLAPWEVVSSLQKPILMALHGHVLGGGLEIALMGDVLISTPETFFAQPEIKLALLPGCGGTLRLLQTIGYHQAFDMIASGRTVSSKEAYHLGLVHHVIEHEKLLPYVLEKAQKMAEHPLECLRSIKRVMRKGFDESSLFEQWLCEERRAFKKLLIRKDAKEKLQSFLVK